MHHMLTQDKAQLFSMYPELPGLGFELKQVEDGLPTFSAMATAEVLVSTGSSYPVAAATLAKLGRQLHIAFPPKELGTGPFLGLPKASRKRLLAGASERSSNDLRANGWWRTYFVRRNTVPVDLQGKPMPPYGVKLAAMLEALDTSGQVEPAIASVHIELWLPGRYQADLWGDPTGRVQTPPPTDLALDSSLRRQAHRGGMVAPEGGRLHIGRQHARHSNARGSGARSRAPPSFLSPTITCLNSSRMRDVCCAASPTPCNLTGVRAAGRAGILPHDTGCIVPGGGAAAAQLCAWLAAFGVGGGGDATPQSSQDSAQRDGVAWSGRCIEKPWVSEAAAACAEDVLLEQARNAGVNIYMHRHAVLAACHAPATEQVTQSAQQQSAPARSTAQLKLESASDRASDVALEPKAVIDSSSRTRRTGCPIGSNGTDLWGRSGCSSTTMTPWIVR